MTIQGQLTSLAEWFAPLGPVPAFSGGIDPGVVVYLSKRFLADNAIGCISVPPSLRRADCAAAMAFCDAYGIALEVIETREIDDAGYAANPPNRCRYCKTHLYRGPDGEGLVSGKLNRGRGRHEPG